MNYQREMHDGRIGEMQDTIGDTHRGQEEAGCDVLHPSGEGAAGGGLSADIHIGWIADVFLCTISFNILHHSLKLVKAERHSLDDHCQSIARLFLLERYLSAISVGNKM
jgi:hypothetical protein